MDNAIDINKSLSFLEKELVGEIIDCSIYKSFQKDTVLIREGQYIKQLPLILNGIVKVYSGFDGRELLLYYIKSRQSCIMSFAAATYNNPSEIFAMTDSESKILLLPSDRVVSWNSRFPRFNQLFFDLYQQRYLDLLENINQLVFRKLDQRLYAYLKNLSVEKEKEILNIRHREIARDLGTAREVITRTMKKLEKERKVEQLAGGIKIL